nr:putative transcription factor interactor and regulator CCHC(Zn) family [Ipomoea batatas]
MTENIPSSSIIPHEPRIIVQDNTPFPSGIILDDTNYPLWSQLMEKRIGARNKSGFLTSTIPKPIADDKQLETWLIDNNRVKSWLIDSMSSLLMQTVKEIWEAVAKTFYDGSDETQIFELNRRSFTTHQNGRPLSLYYNELIGIFWEIDARVQTKENNAEVIIPLHKHMTRLRVHIFLAGLDP